MGLFGRTTAETGEKMPQKCRVKVFNPEGKIIYETVTLEDDLDWDNQDGVYVKATTPDEKEVIIMPGHNLVVIEYL